MKKIMNRVYLAGPDVFREDAEDYFDNLCNVLLSNGLNPKTPIDGKEEESLSIYKSNVALIKDCDFVLANLDIFRGPSADSGTVFEIGYASALGKRIIGYYNKPEIYNYYARAKMFGVSDPYYKIEDFNLSDNLMVIHSCEEIFDDINIAIKYIAMEVGVVSRQRG